MSNNSLFLRPFKVTHKSVAHNIENGERTKDIHVSENVNFSFFALSSSVTDGLKACGFVKPSPVQFKAIPLGKCGLDLIIQAKSGTGKTCVFTVLSLETVKVDLPRTQVLILAPTREVAVQIMQVLSEIGCFVHGIKVECFIGGTSVDIDIKKAGNCHIAVGTPGRIKHLMELEQLDIGSLRLLVLDEADKLLSNSFASDTKYIREQISSRTQVIASSATFPDYLKDSLESFMRCPIHVCPESDKIILHGVRQFVMRVKFHGSPYAQYKIKAKQLIDILSTIPYKQCLVFSNYQSRAEAMCNRLSSEGWPAKFISSHQDQPTRLKTMDAFRKFHCRVLLSTDLTARGIDVENVNLIINLDVPQNGHTYLHRIGRSGRYGSYGIAVTLVNEAKEFPKFQEMLGSISCSNFSVALLPPESLSEELWSCDMSNFEQIYGVERAAEEASVPLVKEDEQIYGVERAAEEASVPLVKEEEEMLSDENTKDEQVILHDGKINFDKMEKCGKECMAETKTNFVKKYDPNSREKKYCNGKETFEEETRPLIEEETILKNKSRSELKMNEISKHKEAAEEQKEEIMISKKKHEDADTIIKSKINSYSEEIKINPTQLEEKTTSISKGKPKEPNLDIEDKNKMINLYNEDIDVKLGEKQVEKNIPLNSKEKPEEPISNYNGKNKVETNLCITKNKGKKIEMQHRKSLISDDGLSEKNVNDESVNNDVMTCANDMVKFNISDSLEYSKVEVQSEYALKFAQCLRMENLTKTLPESFDSIMQSYENFQESDTVDIKTFVIGNHFSQNLDESLDISVKFFEDLSKDFEKRKMHEYKRNDLSKEELFSRFNTEDVEDNFKGNEVSDISNECQNDSPEIYTDMITVNDANTVDIYKRDTTRIKDSDSAESVSTMSETSVKAERDDSYQGKLFQSTELSEIPESKHFSSTLESNTVNSVYAEKEIENSIEINTEVENSVHLEVKEDSAAAEGKLLPDISASSSKYVVKADEDKLLCEAVPVWHSEYVITESPKRASKRRNSDSDYEEILSDYQSGDTGKSVSSQNDDSEGKYSGNYDIRCDGEYELEDSSSEDEIEESELGDEEGATSQQYDCTLPSLEYPVNSGVNHDYYTQEDASHTENHHFEGWPDCVPECAHPYLKYVNWRKEMLKVKKRIQNTEYMKPVSPYYRK